MKRIIIIGNSGSGKSTLAKQLKNEHQLAYLDLDTLAWLATDPPTRKPFSESKEVIETFMHNNKEWVVEGCYADLLEVVSSQANHIVFMDLLAQQCQENAKNRPWEPHKYESKEAQDANLNMLLEWIAAYETREDEFSYKAHNSLFRDFRGTKNRITENQSCVPLIG